LFGALLSISRICEQYKGTLTIDNVIPTFERLGSTKEAKALSKLGRLWYDAVEALEKSESGAGRAIIDELGETPKGVVLRSEAGRELWQGSATVVEIDELGETAKAAVLGSKAALKLWMKTATVARIDELGELAKAAVLGSDAGRELWMKTATVARIGELGEHSKAALLLGSAAGRELYLGKEESEWVQCDTCSKWHELPPGTAAWPKDESFVCSSNSWNPSKASCEEPGDTEEQTGDRASSPFPSSEAPSRNSKIDALNGTAQCAVLRNAEEASAWLEHALELEKKSPGAGGNKIDTLHPSTRQRVLNKAAGRALWTDRYVGVEKNKQGSSGVHQFFLAFEKLGCGQVYLLQSTDALDLWYRYYSGLQEAERAKAMALLKPVLLRSALTSHPKVLALWAHGIIRGESCKAKRVEMIVAALAKIFALECSITRKLVSMFGLALVHEPTSAADAATTIVVASNSSSSGTSRSSTFLEQLLQVVGTVICWACKDDTGSNEASPDAFSKHANKAINDEQLDTSLFKPRVGAEPRSAVRSGPIPGIPGKKDRSALILNAMQSSPKGTEFVCTKKHGAPVILGALGGAWLLLKDSQVYPMVSPELKALVELGQVVMFSAGRYKLAGPIKPMGASTDTQQPSADQSDATVPAGVGGGSEIHPSQTASSKEQKREKPVAEPPATKRMKQAGGTVPVTNGGAAVVICKKCSKVALPKNYGFCQDHRAFRAEKEEGEEHKRKKPKLAAVLC
jgi:hypothetical protein